MSQQNASDGIVKAKTKKSEALWMMTFADLSFILMCFFALQISFSKPNKQQFENVMDGMVEKPRFQEKHQENLKSLATKISTKIKKKKLQNSAKVKLDAEGLAIEFRDNLLFRAGSAKASPKMLKAAGDILDIIGSSAKKYHISIEGHTDDAPLIGHRLYRSNWDLSAARGITLLNSFVKKGVEKSKLRVVAYAATRPKIDPTHLTGANLRRARAINRRVVIRIE